MEPTTNPTSAVNPSQASIDGLAARPDDDAIIMVNMLRYRPDGGSEAYARYGAVAGGTVRARGGSAPYTAAVVEPDAPWHRVTLVRYPKRAAYLDMQTDPAYLGAIPDRTAGLSARLLYAFHAEEPGHDDSFLFTQHGGDEVFVVTLIRFNDIADRAGWSPVGDVVLRLQGDHPMVSDGRWDELVVTRYSSFGAIPATAQIGPGIDAHLSLVTQPAGWEPA